MTRIPQACKVQGCNDLSRKRGLCSPHYDQARRGSIIVEGVSFPLCDETDCERPQHGKGLCHSHYRKAKGQTLEGKADRDRRNREWHAKNRERVSERKRQYREADPERLRIRAREYRQANLEKERIRSRELYKKNPELGKARARTRRARKLNAFVESFTPEDVITLYGSDCHICLGPIDLTAPRHARKGEGWEMGLHIDHVTPLARGGLHSLENARPSHAKCNLSKGAR